MKKILFIIYLFPVFLNAQLRSNGNALGTPSSVTLTNGTGLPVSTGISGLGSNVATFLATASSANLRSALTDENGTGAALFNGATTPDFTTGITIGGAAANGKILVGNGSNFVPATNNGGWDTATVSGSNFTTSSTSLVDITGLVTTNLAVATTYEFEAVLFCNSSSTAGMAFGVQQSGTGSGQVGAWSGTATSATATGIVIASNALNQAGAPCVLVNGDGVIIVKGFVKTGSSGTPTITAKALKTTSGTATVYIGSKIRWRKINNLWLLFFLLLGSVVLEILNSKKSVWNQTKIIL